MADTQKAEDILWTYMDSSHFSKSDPNWEEFKAECKSIRKVLRIVVKHNAKQDRKQAKRKRPA